MASETEVAAMRRAVVLAERGLGRTSPNPVVGCVVVDAAGDTVGEGFHEYAGGPHAEVVALRRAGRRARGAALAVTLEPCGHTGRTGPCVTRILDAGVERVLVGVRDPNPDATGGLDRLRAAGIDVELGVLASEAERVNEAWLTAVRRSRPFVTWKYAASLDGRVAAADGGSRWITGPEARADAHRLRGRSDAVLVGSGAVLADDPRLTVRTPGDGAPSAPSAPSESVGDEPPDPDSGAYADRRPLRVIADTDARTPATARVLDAQAPTLFAVAPDARADHLEAGACAVRLPRAEHGLDLLALLDELYARGVVSVLTEGGPTLAGGLLARGLLDRVVGYVAPALIGGGGLPALGGSGALSVDAVHRLRLDDVTRVGDDLRIVARWAHDGARDGVPEEGRG